MTRDMRADMAKLRGLRRPYARQVLRRLSLLVRWEHVREEAKEQGVRIELATAGFVDRLKEAGDTDVSLKSLYEWRRAYLADGWRGLIDQRRRRDRPAPADPNFLAELLREYRRMGDWFPRPASFSYRAALCHSLATDEARRRGWRPCTQRESVRFLRGQVLIDSEGDRGGVGAA